MSGLLKRCKPLLALVYGVVWALPGCSPAGDEQSERFATCAPNIPLVCACPGGLSSMTTCLPDGSGTAPCACNGAGGAGSAGTTTMTSGGNAGVPQTGGFGGGVAGSWVGAGGSASNDPMGAVGGSSGSAPAGLGGAGAGGTPVARPIGAGGMEVAGEGGTGAAGTGAAGMPPATAGSGGAPDVGPGTPSTGCGVPSVPPSGNMTIDVEGTEREYIVTVPSDYDPNRPYRLIFAWHGLGGTAKQVASTYYGLALRSGNGAIFIAGQGLPGTGQQSGFAAWSNTGDSDITFTRKMLDWAKASYCIDTERVFSIGMSNGALMSNVVGCELGDSFRAMAAMSGGGPKGYALKPCIGQIAAWMSHGNQDNNVPFSYGEASRDYWTKVNHCGSATVPVMPGTCLEYQDCDEGFPVHFCEFDGGHMVPSFTGEAAWNFFARF